MWLLLHTMLANAEHSTAGAVLSAVHVWVKEFFGCMECSMHFQTTWAREGGARMASHDTAVLWLWQVHNLVSSRVSAERREQVRTRCLLPGLVSSRRF